MIVQYRKLSGTGTGTEGHHADSPTVTIGIGSEGKVRKTTRPFTARQGVFLLGARQHPETDELLAVLVAEAKPGGRVILEIEVDPSYMVVDAAADTRGGKVIGIGTFAAALFSLG